LENGQYYDQDLPEKKIQMLNFNVIHVKTYVVKMGKPIYWRLPFWAFKKIYMFRNQRNMNLNIVFERIQKLILISDQTSDAEIFIGQRERIHLYWRGVTNRIEELLRQYRVNEISLSSNGVEKEWIVDIGANVGEFSMGMIREHSSLCVLAIEPSPKEYAALSKNLMHVPLAQTENLALRKERTTLKFFHKNQTGDSSLLPGESTKNFSVVQVDTLDSLTKKYDIRKILILKLEAEGAEPEILLGAIETLKLVKYVTADLGPERGPSQERTYEKCRDLLKGAGFEEIGTPPGSREVYLFRNSAFNQSD